MMRAGAGVLLAALAAAAAADAARAQDLRARLRAAGTGDVTFHFEAREGVCGDGDVVVRQRPGNGTTISFTGEMSVRNGRDFDNLDTWCRPGPVHVRIERSGDGWSGLRIAVGAPYSGANDLGAVPASEAVTVLVEDIARTASASTARRALHAASLAAAESWQPMLALAHDVAVDAKTRKSAIQWLAVEASDHLIAGRTPFDDTMELRRQAVFALSRREDTESRAALRELAAPGTAPEIRAAAVYWLGVSDGEDALQILENVLRGR